ncbi:MAG TPA: glycerophosphotransferase, partial [Pseudomonas sp.]|nr:glycerophosphotransferase [Pseudomonas sp.]
MKDARRKVGFLYIAQTHQILHSLPIALAMTRVWPDVDVEILATTQEHLDYVRSITDRLGLEP